LITSSDFDIFESKVKIFDAFFKKQKQKKSNFSTSIPNFGVDFHLMINPIMGKGSLNRILYLIKKSFTYFPNIS